MPLPHDPRSLQLQVAAFSTVIILQRHLREFVVEGSSNNSKQDMKGRFTRPVEDVKPLDDRRHAPSMKQRKNAMT